MRLKQYGDFGWPMIVAICVTGLTAFVGVVLGIYWLIWAAYEHCVRAVFTSMPHATYWQFVGILFVVSIFASMFRGARK